MMAAPHARILLAMVVHLGPSDHVTITTLCCLSRISSNPNQVFQSGRQSPVGIRYSAIWHVTIVTIDPKMLQSAFFQASSRLLPTTRQGFQEEFALESPCWRNLAAFTQVLSHFPWGRCRHQAAARPPPPAVHAMSHQHASSMGIQRTNASIMNKLAIKTMFSNLPGTIFELHLLK